MQVKFLKLFTFLFGLLLTSNIVFSQCDNINVKYDKFYKTTSTATKESLILKESIFTAHLSLSSPSGYDLKFWVHIKRMSFDIDNLDEKDIENYTNQIIILFTDGSTIRIGDQFDQLNLNKGIPRDATKIHLLKTKTVESIRFSGNSNYDFDLNDSQKLYFIQNVKCMFP